jgi:stage II sporulation protein E
MKHSGRHENGKTGSIRVSAVSAALPELYALAGPYLRTVLILIGYFLMGMLLARGALAGMLAPLGVSFVAAVSCRRTSSRLYGAAALCGSFLGYMLSSGAVDGLKYCAAAALCYAVGLVLRGLPALRRIWFPSLAAGSSLLLTSAVYFLSYGAGLREAALYGCEVLLAMGAAYCYRPLTLIVEDAREAKSERPPNYTAQPDRTQRLACLVASGLSIVLVLCGFPLFAGMSAGRLAAVYLCLCVAAIDPVYGCACGVCVGIAVGVSLEAGAQTAVIYALSALVAGLFAKFGLFWLILAFTACHAALLPWLWPSPPMAPVYECFAAGVIFYLSGQSVRSHTEKLVRACARAENDAQEKSFAASIRGKLAGTARAFSVVAGDVVPSPEPAEDPNRDLYRLALDRVCRSCPLSGNCHKISGELTRAALEEARIRILAVGHAVPEDFPPFFSARCQKLPEFIGAVNESIALRESRTRYARRARDDALLLGAQYGAIGELLEQMARQLAPKPEPCEEENRALRRALAQNDIALGVEVARSGGRYVCTVKSVAHIKASLRRTLEHIAGQVLGRTMRLDDAGPPDAPALLRESICYSASVAVSSQPKGGEEASGDNCAYFKTADGIVYLVLSDGMGSGAEASRESESFLKMLEHFLRSGVQPDTALRLIHPAFTIKCGGDSFTTCDILRIDLYTGAAQCYKCGAAPTYVCPVGAIPRKISSVSMPVGLPSAEPAVDCTSLALHTGDVAVMLSDGLAEEDDRWMLELLQENRGASAEDLTALILDQGRTRCGTRDDMTVLAVKLSAYHP